MARSPLRFKQADVLRAVKGARAAGMELGRVEIDPTGRIVLVAAGEVGTPEERPLDKWLKEKEKRNA